MHNLNDLIDLEREHVEVLRAHIWYPRSSRGQMGRWDSHRPEVLQTLLSNEWTRKWYMELLTKSQLASLHTTARQQADPNHVPPPDTPIGSPIELTDEDWEEVRQLAEVRKEQSEKQEAEELETWKNRDWALYIHRETERELGLI